VQSVDTPHLGERVHVSSRAHTLQESGPVGFFRCKRFPRVDEKRHLRRTNLILFAGPMQEAFDNQSSGVARLLL